MWVVGGLVLAAIELATPGGFFVLFFGISAVIVGLLELAGVGGPAWVQWLLFPAIALVALRLFRPRLLAHLNAGEPVEVDSLVGELAIAEAEIAAGHHGRAELRGTSWQARNVGDTTLGRGQRARVSRVDGLTLDIRAE